MENEEDHSKAHSKASSKRDINLNYAVFTDYFYKYFSIFKPHKC